MVYGKPVKVGKKLFSPNIHASKMHQRYSEANFGYRTTGVKRAEKTLRLPSETGLGVHPLAFDGPRGRFFSAPNSLEPGGFVVPPAMPQEPVKSQTHSSQQIFTWKLAQVLVGLKGNDVNWWEGNGPDSRGPGKTLTSDCSISGVSPTHANWVCDAGRDARAFPLGNALFGRRQTGLVFVCLRFLR